MRFQKSPAAGDLGGEMGTRMKSRDYFPNLPNAGRWPFSIYHNGIVAKTIELASVKPSYERCLNIGCGLFASYPRFRALGRWYACDIDERCVEAVGARYAEVECRVCGRYPEYPAAFFDLIVATEVIEHVSDPGEWLRRIIGLLKPGGALIVSTPNYGLSLLPIVEYTFLQMVALTKGFSRFGIHPNKYTKARLRQHLSECAPQTARSIVKRCSLGMALVGRVAIGR
jgi:SAM-dependent methyltransferase